MADDNKEIKKLNGHYLMDSKARDAIDSIRNDITDIDSRLSALLDILNPFDISSISVSPNVSQMGSTVDVKLKWNYTASTIQSQTINNEDVENTLREKTFTGVNKTTTYTLVGISNKGTKKQKSATITFANGIYYGKSNRSTYDSALINSLTKQISNSKNRSITVNAGAGEYIFYCLPTRLGACSFNVGGFDGGFDKVATIAHTNSDGFSESYDIYKSVNDNLGSTTVTVK